MKRDIKYLMMAAALFTCMHNLNAQSWNIIGNSNATTSSKLGTTNNIPVRLFTYNAERIHINANVSGKVGYVGIGTTVPNTLLHVNGVITALGGTSTNWNLAYTRVPTGATSKVPRWNGTSYVAGLIFDNAINVGIGTTTPSYKLHVVNTGTAIYGNSTSGGYGVWGNGAYLGVYGSGSTYGVYGSGTTGVFGSGTSYGLYGNGGTYGVYGSGVTYGVYGKSTSGYGISGVSTNGYGLYGSNTNSGWGVVGYGGYGGTYGSGATYGVYGTGTSNGVYGNSSSGVGVYGYSTNYQGGHFYSVNNYGLWAKTGRADYNWAGVFEGTVYTYNTYQTSDKNLKKNIEDVDNAMDIINQLKPKIYEFRNDGKLANMNLPKGRHYGVLAQDLEVVLPNLVKEVENEVSVPEVENEVSVSKVDSNGTPTSTPDQLGQTEKIKIKSVNYTELIPIIIKGMQEQQKGMQEQQQEIAELKAENKQLKQDMQNYYLNHSPGNKDKMPESATDKALLEQNMPNPFTQQTLIRYYIPAGSTGELKVISLDGREMYTAPLTTGFGELTISAHTLSAGTYTYVLIVDGKAVESKKMVLTQ